MDEGGCLGPKEGVIPRATSIYRRFDFSALPPSKRRAALEVAARHGPAAAPQRYACRWQDGVAHVWAPRDPMPVGDEIRLVAESSLLPKAEGDAVRLVALRDGVEGQAWTAGVLAASRCWPEPPSAEQWGRFLRAAGRTHSSDVPAVETLPRASSAWGEGHERMAWRPAQLEAFAWRAVVLGVALAVGWHVAALATWALAQALQANRLESLRTDSAPLILARERAEAAQARLVSLHRLADAPSDLALLAEFRRTLAPEVRLLGWSRDGTRLRVELQGAGTDPRPVVQAFAGHPMLGGLVVNPIDGGRMLLDVDLPPSGERPTP